MFRDIPELLAKIAMGKDSVLEVKVPAPPVLFLYSTCKICSNCACQNVQRFYYD
jgi:hypothetical protein